MARLDAYLIQGMKPGTYVVDIQTDFLSQLETRVVVPLVPASEAAPPIRELNPVIEIAGIAHIFVTQALSAVPGKDLRKPVFSLQAHHDAITRALDMLLVGY